MTFDGQNHRQLEYNFLNLLLKVEGMDASATYRWLADGTKASVTDNLGYGFEYLGSFVYQKVPTDLALESISFGSGRFVANSIGYVTPNYYITDHLGSVRVVFTSPTNVVAQNDYYAFGLRHSNPNLANSSANRHLFNGKEWQSTGSVGLLDYGARMLDSRLGRWFGVDLLAEKYYSISPYVYCLNNPIRYTDPNGKKVRPANAASFNILLLSLPAATRSMITMNSNGFIDASSVNTAYSIFGSSGNLQELRDLVLDERIVDFDATATSFNYINAENGQVETSNFVSPVRANVHQKLLSEFRGTPQDKRAYAQQLISYGILDEVEVSGNFGATLRPSNAQQPYPGGQVSTTNNFQVYVNPVGTTPTEQAKNVGHELFGHLYFWFMGKDPRHGGASGKLGGSPELDQQIINREREAGINSQYRYK